MFLCIIEHLFCFGLWITLWILWILKRLQSKSRTMQRVCIFAFGMVRTLIILICTDYKLQLHPWKTTLKSLEPQLISGPCLCIKLVLTTLANVDILDLSSRNGTGRAALWQLNTDIVGVSLNWRPSPPLAGIMKLVLSTLFKRRLYLYGIRAGYAISYLI